MAAHSSILAWKIPWTEELGRLQPMGLQRVRYTWVKEHAQVYPKGVKSPSLVSPLLGRQDPQKVCLWRAVGLTFRRVRGRVQTKKSHIFQNLGRSIKLQRASVKPIYWLESLPERQKVVGAQPGDIDTGGSYFWELVLPYRHGQVLVSTILKSFL